ncbi:MmcQ/YjbR family DNA-binding protein [Phenylobacterium sp.]|uniref:MmcQ/YjbR family DNA-binding protein n=1 Tax=Phenylobacterium sp. TaxID=1871053 RepID=UPI002735F8EF|nr:MmcQ/YjbR family DNA-binding protein [Phenylobacterium sp.]MDP3855212.1 MmcQ/YjbR family DNA-binding protein [Phenylobacterium sp.]
MTSDGFETAALALRGATKVVQWGGARVYKVGGRIFAIAGLGGAISLKVTDLAYEVLVETGQARPAPYLARAKWVAFDDLEGLDDSEVVGWLATAHALVAAKLTRAQRAELGL